jgi:RimJ/RimL family protein N-acetyltransferase
MTSDKETTPHVIACGERVMLRGFLASDEDAFVRWWTTGEWLEYDAPREELMPAETHEDRERIRARFRKRLAERQDPASWGQAVIATLDNVPLGWVNRYDRQFDPPGGKVGIDICEDAYLNRGFGTEALNLWVEYLFAECGLQTIGLDTWSMNPRMVRVAEKVGFVITSRERRARRWQGEWLDAIHMAIER